jgi:hypothetical protein
MVYAPARSARITRASDGGLGGGFGGFSPGFFDLLRRAPPTAGPSGSSLLERLLEVGQFRNVEIQVMPTDLEDHAGLAGGFRLFKLTNGVTLGYAEVLNITRLISEPREVQYLEMQYGSIRAQALTPRESLAFIEKVLGEP